MKIIHLFGGEDVLNKSCVLLVGNWTELQWFRYQGFMTATDSQVLVELFQQSRDTQRPSTQSLGRSLNLSRGETAAALLRLEARGLVDAGRVRLTLSGLVVANQLSTQALRLSDSARPSAA